MTTPVLNPFSATWLVAKREIISQIRTKSFVISTVILLVAIFVMAIFGGRAMESEAEATSVAVVSQTEDVLAGDPQFSLVPADDEAAASALVESGEVDAAVVPTEDPSAWPGYKLVVQKEVPLSLQMATTMSPEVEILTPDDEDESDFLVGYVVSMVFGIAFMMSVMTFGSTIAQNTVVEKQTRTVELLVTAVSPRALLAGKILGSSALAIGQTVAVVLCGTAGLAVVGQTAFLSMLTASMLWFCAFFVLGFVLFAAIFAASASLVSRIEDTGSVLAPIMMLTMLPYMIVIFFGQNPLVMAVASYVPFTSVVAMPVRVFTEGVSWWDPILSLLILGASDFLVILAAARVYHASVLKMGSRVRLTEAWNAEEK